MVHSCRHAFYNTPREVVLTIFAEDVLVQGVVVDFGDQKVCSTYLTSVILMLLADCIH
jgi:hypothetical protein